MTIAVDMGRKATKQTNKQTTKIANNMDPDQTAPLGAVWSGFIVFASIMKLVWSAFEYRQQMY